MLADKVVEMDFFRGALQKVEARRQRRGSSGENDIYDQIREMMSMQGSLSVEQMCQFGRPTSSKFACEASLFITLDYHQSDTNPVSRQSSPLRWCRTRIYRLRPIKFPGNE